VIEGKPSLPVAIYLRVSTDTQTTDNQRLALEAAATVRGWNVVQLYQDQGISGAKHGRTLATELKKCDDDGYAMQKAKELLSTSTFDSGEVWAEHAQSRRA
jgi:hypothetical protein